MDYPILKLKAGKEVSIKYKHPWVFSGALEENKEKIVHGSLVKVSDPYGNILGVGTYSNKSMITVRIFDFSDAEIGKEWLAKKIKQASDYRTFLGYGGSDTSGYRLVFGESDNLPGLIVDKFDDVLVIQISTKGMELLKPIIIEVLNDLFKPKAIIENSDLATRNEEGMNIAKGILASESEDQVIFKENGYKFFADPLNGQKTGYFLDQKDLRQAVSKWSDGRTVLNLFSYTGATSVYALKGGAKSVLNIDGSELALEGCAKNASLNKIAAAKMKTEKADIFAWLGRPIHEPEYDMVISDPPAIIKSKGDIESGKKAYHFLNRAAMRLVKDGGIFVTSSCSHYLSTADLRMILHRAAVQNNLTLRIISEFSQSADHPVSLSFPESAYLKSFICLVERN